MTEGVEVTLEDVHAMAGWLETSAREFTTDLNNLLREVRSFVGGDWNGPAAGTHDEAWDEWEQGARQVIDGLEQDAAALHRVASGLQRIDQENGGAINEIDFGAV